MKSAAVTPTSILLLRELSGAERPFELAEINRLRRSPALSAFLPQLPDRREVRGECRHLRLDRGDFLFITGAAARFFGLFQRFGCLGFVEVVAADRGVSEHGDHFGLDLEYPSRHKDQLLGAAARRLDAHRPRLDAGDEGGVARGDAELANFPREPHALRLARVDALLGADDI